MKPAVEKLNPVKELQAHGQSVWLDYIRRSLITSGELQALIDDDGLRGMTSNPSIFEKAISGSKDYQDILDQCLKDRSMDANAIYEKIAVRDIQDAADILLPVYKSTKRTDGYVSLEVSPLLASDTEKTIAEAKRLWKAVGRENIMIKVPATPEGIPAFRELISQGINVNVTLMFAQEVYEQVAEAYIAGLEALAQHGGDVSKMASVASFFVSRIDTSVDNLITHKLENCKDDSERVKLNKIMGKTAIANAKMAYQRFQNIYRSARWQALQNKGAHVQRLLWASTSTKNPSYRDTIYIEELIGKETVNTVPPATLDAFRDHGEVRDTLIEDPEDAREVMETLGEVGISMKQVTDDLLKEGVVLFSDSFKKLLAAIDDQRNTGSHSAIDRLAYKLPNDLSAKVKDTFGEWNKEHKTSKLWHGDASLWTGEDESKWLGWLGITEGQLGQVNEFKELAQSVKEEKFSHALLLGMGGSSLCPEVMSQTFGKKEGFPELHILDSTDPAQIKTIEHKVKLDTTLFFVSSKSGTTLEPNIYKQYFFDRVQSKVGKEKAGHHFIAITDPGSKMQEVAERDNFRHTYFGLPSIGGRYSALSNFGMIPSAAMGVDVEKLLNTTEEMVHACSATVPVEENPGAVLGVIMGVLAKAGRDKVTLVCSPSIHDLGAWLEQLLAESTGKQGHGIIPVDREALGAPSVYGSDRLFVYIRCESKADKNQDLAIEALEKAGQPVVRISLPDIDHIGQEFFRWEFATAVAGAIIGINAFNQPDVEASKVETRKLTDEYEKTGSLPAEKPIYEDGSIKLFCDQKNADALNKAAGTKPTLESYLRAHFDRLNANDYFALLAYIEMNDEHEKSLQDLRHQLRDIKKVATCLGFGPRFLHSTGQAYKGGPNTGVFLQVTCDDKEDLAVPGQKYTFGTVKAAQARGDFQVLADRGRRALRVHLGKDVKASLAKLKEALKKALS